MIPKFRAWDKEENRMIDDYEVLISSDGCAYYNHYEGGLRDLGLDVEIMQSTGLKDKNGVEIYENDIVKTFGANIYVVEFYDGKFNPISDLETSNWEAIGNIYENPELLKGHEK